MSGKLWHEFVNGVLNCQRCPLSKRTRPVPGYGNRRSRLLLLGMEPGDMEERDGKPFVGPSGRLLADLFRFWGLPLDSLYRTNTVRCRPRDYDTGEKRNCNEIELAACADWTEQEIGLVDPDVIILFGRTAIPVAFPGERPSVVAGRVRAMEYAGRSRVFVASYHPAAILHQRGLLPVLNKSVRTAVEILEATNGQS